MKNYAYLSKVNKEKNTNNFCEIIQDDNGSITIKQGIVGKQPLVLPFTKHDDFHALVEEKKLLGFEDNSMLHSSTTNAKTEALSYEPIEDSEINSMITEIIKASRQFANNNYIVSIEQITDKMITEAENDIYKLYEIKDQYNNSLLTDANAIERFNERLATLFGDIPRKIDDFDKAFASSVNDFDLIIEDEELKIEAVKSVKKENELNVEKKSGTFLEAHGLSIRPCTYKEEDNIIGHLGHDYSMGGIRKECERRFVKAYAVENAKTQQAFDNYVNKMGFSEQDKTIRYMYHGTKTENVVSIICDGLKLNPDARKTGEMFGHGVYHAPEAKKAFNYMDTKGSRWNNGKNESGFTIIHAVALGNPFYPTRSGAYNADNIPKGTHSVFARKGTCRLKNDECIVYREDQSTIKYLMEITHKNVRDLQFNLNRNILRDNLQDAFSTLQKTPDGVSAVFEIDLLNSVVTEEINNKILKNYDVSDISIDYNKKRDTISFKGTDHNGDIIELHPNLTSDDMKFFSREMKKAFAESEREWESIIKSTDAIKTGEYLFDKDEENKSEHTDKAKSKIMLERD